MLKRKVRPVATSCAVPAKAVVVGRIDKPLSAEPVLVCVPYCLKTTTVLSEGPERPGLQFRPSPERHGNRRLDVVVIQPSGSLPTNRRNPRRGDSHRALDPIAR
jgi:hypothetical protein